MGLHGGGADFDFVLAGVLAAGGVDDEGHVFVLHQVDDVWALAAGESREDFDKDAGFADDAAGASGGVEGEAEVGVALGDAGDVGAVGFLDVDADVSACGQDAGGGHLAFGEGHAKVEIHAHDFAGAFHFGAEDDVRSGEFAEGEECCFGAVMPWDEFLGEAEFLQGLAGHDLGVELGQRDADGFADEGGGSFDGGGHCLSSGLPGSPTSGWFSRVRS